ncbi:MAG: caspase family protein [Candidatus Latescibacterota bacterium]
MARIWRRGGGVCAALLLLAGAGPLAAEKWALLVGVNDYLYGPDYLDLRGCRNDVTMTRDLLTTRFGFAPDRVRTLLDGEATRAGILAAVEEWLVQRPAPEDLVYFHFSGHGAQVDDADGDEEDGQDEVLCPADLRLGEASTVITDDELRRVLGRVRARHVTVVLDACHSGTGTRDIARSRPRFVDFYAGVEQRAISITPVSGTQQDVVLAGGAPAEASGEADTGPPPDKLAGSGGMEGEPGHLVTISGCQPEQTSADAWIGEGFHAGALTYHLIGNMKKAPPGIAYRELMERVVRDIKAAQIEQTPQLEGDMDRPLMGAPAESVPALPFLLVSSVEGGFLVLGGGRSQDVTAGSVYALYPPTQTDLAGPGVARARVEAVAQSSARARLLDAARVEPGYRAREVYRHFAAGRLRLLVEDGGTGLAASLTGPLSRLGFVEVVGGEHHYDRRLQLAGGAGGWQAALTFDGVPEAVVSAADAPALVEALRPHLENAFTIKFLAGLDNPSPPFRVRIWANRAPAGPRGLQRLEQAPDEKLVRARIGDTVRLSFQAERDCYLTLINVGTTGKITVLFPNQYRPDGFVRGGQVYSTESPGEMPFRIRAKGPPGRESVKVIATLEPLRLASLSLGTQAGQGTRAIESGSRFAQQLATDLAGGQTPDPASGWLLPADRWTADYLIVETAE